MPLTKGKSKTAFEGNVATEMRAGRPQDQALAIAYSEKRNSKAYGGEMDDSASIKRIMAKRKVQRMSEGGIIANGGDDDLDDLADGRPNNFDDLALRDDLEFSETGANSGDELGNDTEDETRKTTVDRIMRQRAMKRNSNPRPA